MKEEHASMDKIHAEMSDTFNNKEMKLGRVVSELIELEDNKNHLHSTINAQEEKFKELQVSIGIFQDS